MPDFSDSPCPFPTASMAVALSRPGVDLADDGACEGALLRAGFTRIEVERGLERAIERARTLNATPLDGWLLLSRDLAACAVLAAGTLMGALPAVAAEGAGDALGIAIPFMLVAGPVLGFVLGRLTAPRRNPVGRDILDLRER